MGVLIGMDIIILVFLAAGLYGLYRRGKRRNSISNHPDEGSLMERATNMAIHNQLQSANPASILKPKKQHLWHMGSNDDFHHQQLMDSADTANLLNDMHDPYKTPGVDMIIDESYHGIDHGMGIANPDQHNHNNGML